MSPDELVLYVEALFGHFVMAAFGIFAMMLLKDSLTDFLKSWKWRRNVGLKEGDAITLDGHSGVVSSIKSGSVSIVLHNGGLHLRVIDISKVGSLNIQRVIVPSKELHKHN